MEILGITLDCRFGFTDHVASILKRAKDRLGIQARLAGCVWGAEVGVLRRTGKALVVSVLRYGLAVYGSGTYENSLTALEVGIVNPLARRICGVGVTARIPTLQMAARVLSAHNLFLQHCAGMVDATLRADGSSIRERVVGLLCEAYGVGGWGPRQEPVQLASPPPLPAPALSS